MQLTRWNNWKLDGTDSAARCSTVWRELLATQDINNECQMVQFRQPDLCTLEASFDGGSNWELIYDASACVQNGINDAIAGYLADGTLGGAQSGGQGEIDVYFCKHFHVTLHGNQKWLCPIPVGPNYRITTSNATGGAFDGALVAWNCPNGDTYALGGCIPDSADTEAGDPINTVFHMRLVMQYDGDFYDAYNLEHAVSSSLSGLVDLEFQVNDSTLNDNSGDYQFDLEICNFGLCEPSFTPEDKMNISFNNDEITIQVHSPNPGANGAYQCYGHVADSDGDPCPCRALQIISLTGYTLPDSETPHNGGAVYPCGASPVVNERGTGANWQTFYNNLSDTNKCLYDFDIKSTTPFTIVFKIVDCP